MALPIREKTQIKTERLILKPYSEQDMDALINLLTDPEITSTFMVRVVIQNFLKKPVISTVFKADE